MEDPARPSAPSLKTRLLMRFGLPVLRLLVRLLVASWRFECIAGKDHLDQAIASGSAFLPCCWHQRLATGVGYLLTGDHAGLRTGILVSPSRDGEIAAGIAQGLGATILRGSATRTGARALRDLYTTLKDGVCPVMHPDGPHGPGFEAKTGSAMLAQMTGASLLPMGGTASRYWQIGSWDRLIIPKPFAKIAVVIGAPIAISRGEDTAACSEALADRLDMLMAEADAALGVAPRRPRRLGERHRTTA